MGWGPYVCFIFHAVLKPLPGTKDFFSLFFQLLFASGTCVSWINPIVIFPMGYSPHYICLKGYVVTMKYIKTLLSEWNQLWLCIAHYYICGEWLSGHFFKKKYYFWLWRKSGPISSFPNKTFGVSSMSPVSKIKALWQNVSSVFSYTLRNQRLAWRRSFRL